MVKILELPYLAGIVDGEGSVVLQKPQSQPQWQRFVTISNAYLPLLMAIEKQFGGKVSKLKRNNFSTKSCFQWQLTKKEDIVKFLEPLIPYLMEKKEQAEVMLAVCRLPHARNKEFVTTAIERAAARVKELKHFDFGPSWENEHPVESFAEELMDLGGLLDVPLDSNVFRG